MRRLSFRSLVGSFLFMVSAVSPALADEPKAIVRDALAAVFVDFDARAVERLFTEDYIQHNPLIPTGRAPIIGFLPALKESGISITTHRLIAEGDLVVAHNSFENAQLLGAQKVVSFDVFRVENGRVAEHWDNIAPITAPNPSGRTQLDGPTQASDFAHTAQNKALVRELIEAVLIGGDFARLDKLINAEGYAQHNSQIADGLSGLAQALEAMAKQGVVMKYDALHMIVAEGDFVFTISEGTLGGEPTAFFDLFRVENNMIVEHWDVISGVPAEMAHENGKF